MIKAKQNIFVYLFFKFYTKIKIHNNFKQVVINGNVDITDSSVLLLSNHISWWDGFWAFYLNMKILGKKFYFMMDEKELAKRQLFSYMGGFSIANNKRSMFQSIQYTSQLLQRKENLVLVYPQGKLHSVYDDNFSFKKGIEHILLPADDKVKIILLVQLIDYYQYPKPTVFLYYEEADMAVSKRKNYEEQYSLFFAKCVKQHRQLTV